MSYFLRPHGLYSPWNSPGQNTGVGSPSPGDLHNPGIEPRSPALQADSLPAEPQGKPKNTGVGSLSLPQQIFPIQELNRGLLHCRRIFFYQLSYLGSPRTMLLLLLLSHFSRVQLCATPETAAHQASPSPGISHRYTYIPSLLNLPPIFLPIPPF